MSFDSKHSRGLFAGLVLALALPACADEPETEETFVEQHAGAEDPDSMNDMPTDGVQERSQTEDPARVVVGTRPDGDDYPEMIQVDPAIPESQIVFDLERLEEVCADPSVYFATASAELDEEAKTTVAYLAQCVKHRDVRVVAITGHTDPRGSVERNEELGRERAEAVAELIRQHGVTEPEIQTESMGEQAARYSLFWPADRRSDIDTNPAAIEDAS